MRHGLLLAWLLGAFVLPSTQVSAQDDAPTWPSSLDWQASGGGDAAALIGAVDQPSAGDTISGDSFTVTGWVGDPLAPDGTNVVNVRLYDGDLLLADTQQGDFRGGHATYGLDRSDVVDAIGLQGLETSGFEMVIPTSSFQNGTHTLTVRALRGDGVWAERQVSVVAGAKSTSAQSHAQPAFAPAVPPLAAAPAGRVLVVLVSGWASSIGGASGPAALDALVGQLESRYGYQDAVFFPFSYRGWTWQGSQYVPLAADPADTQQSVFTSAANLRRLIGDLHAREPSARIRVAGFSLGGLVALQELADAVQADDDAARPERVLAIAAPLNGVTLSAKQSVCRRLATAGLIAFAAGGFWVALAGGEAALGTYIACPSGAFADDLNNIHSDSRWRSQRDQAVQFAMQQGTRVGTMGNSGDCVYYEALCMQVLGSGDADDRSTNYITRATMQQQFDLPHQVTQNGAAYGVGLWDIYANHAQILRDQGALQTAATFIAP